MENYFNYLNQAIDFYRKNGKEINVESVKKILGIQGDLGFSQEDYTKFINYNLRATEVLLSDLINTKVFEVDKETGVLLENTNNKSFERNVPFDNFFIDYSLETDDGFFNGFLIIKDKIGITCKCFFKLKGDDLVVDMINKGNSFTVFNIFTFNKLREEEIRTELFEIYKGSGILKELPSTKKLRVFVLNFLDFLNHPNVETRVIKWLNNENRIKKGKLPLPDRIKVNITGKLQRYIYEEYPQQKETHNSPRYSFEVRGHYIHFWNKKKWHLIYSMDVNDLKIRGYTIDNKQTISKWILPYIKGRGILKNKSYNVKK